jgi:hypothetical protein
MLFLSSAAFTSYMTGVLAKNGFSLENVAFIMGVGFMLGAVYFKWVIKTKNIKEVS